MRYLPTIDITGMTAEYIKEGLVKKCIYLKFSSLIAFASDTCNIIKDGRSGTIGKICQEQPKILKSAVFNTP